MRARVVAPGATMIIKATSQRHRACSSPPRCTPSSRSSSPSKTHSPSPPPMPASKPDRATRPSTARARPDRATRRVCRIRLRPTRLRPTPPCRMWARAAATASSSRPSSVTASTWAGSAAPSSASGPTRPPCLAACRTVPSTTSRAGCAPRPPAAPPRPWTAAPCSMAAGTPTAGSRLPPATCGGGGVPNVCGCLPTTCAAAGENCDVIDDGCGGTLHCGLCAAPGDLRRRRRAQRLRLHAGDLRERRQELRHHRRRLRRHALLRRLPLRANLRLRRRDERVRPGPACARRRGPASRWHRGDDRVSLDVVSLRRQ